MDRLLAIEAFVRVAETRSFAQAARQLRVAKSVITTRVRYLESVAQAPLFHRTTRSVRISEVGQAFLDDCAELVARSDRLVARMREMRTAPAGTLRVHALPGFVLGHLGQLLCEFRSATPGSRSTSSSATRSSIRCARASIARSRSSSRSRTA